MRWIRSWRPFAREAAYLEGRGIIPRVTRYGQSPRLHELSRARGRAVHTASTPATGIAPGRALRLPPVQNDNRGHSMSRWQSRVFVFLGAALGLTLVVGLVVAGSL